MVRRSPELEAVAQRWLKAYREADAKAMANLYLDSDASRYIGTDPAEWWHGNEIPAALPAHLAEIRDELEVVFDLHEIEAFEHDSAGWACVSAAVSFRAAQDPLPWRITLFFVLEDGMWQIVQNHNSLGRPNPEVAGVSLTRGLEALLGELADGAEADIRSAFNEGTVAIMFTDIEDSSDWVTKLGDSEWAGVVSWHDGLVRRSVEHGGGTVVKTLGDGAMAVFDSTRGAASAARDIQGAFSDPGDRPAIKVRIGLHVGEVVQTGEDYLGRAVHKAARIASAASGGEVMVSTAVAALLGDTPDFRFGDPVDMELKGIEGIHPVAPMHWTG